MGDAHPGNRLVVWRSRLRTEHGWVTQVVVARAEDPPPQPHAELLGDVGAATWERLAASVPEFAASLQASPPDECAP